MQDNYVGDIGDLAKLGLLRALSGDKTQLGIAWYLYPHEEGTAGLHIEYLDHPEFWRSLDSDLFDGLQGIVAQWRSHEGERSVADAAYLGLLPGTVFADEMLCNHPRSNGEPNRSEWRHGWFARVMERLRDCDIVFADPDSGLCDDDRFHYDGRNGNWKRLPLGEVLELSGGRTTIVYHHNTRFKGGPRAEIEHWMEQLTGCTHAFRCRRYGNRTFFVLNAGNATLVNLMAFVDRWQEAERTAGFSEDQLSEVIAKA